LVALDPATSRVPIPPEAHRESWQRTRQAGVLAPNDIRGEEGWPASTDPTADEPSTPTPAPADDQGKVARWE
jgi:hypothetical protein